MIKLFPRHWLLGMVLATTQTFANPALVNTAQVEAFEQPTFNHPVDEKRYQSLIQDTRCPTCQNSNIAESNAPLARQLREQIAEHILAGRSDGEIVQYLSERYGDFIHYNPPLNFKTLVLWYLPLLAMILSAVWYFRRRPRQEPKLSPEQQAELNAWIAEFRAESLKPSPEKSPQKSALSEPNQPTSQP